MRISRCFVDMPLNVGAHLTLPTDTSMYLVKVLRLRKDADLVLFNGRDGRDYQATLLNNSKQHAEIRINETGDCELPGKLVIHLAIGISRGERMDFALQKAVELGVTEITPLFTKHSVVQLSAERLDKRMLHWHKVITSACEQSGRRYVPILHPTSQLTGWLDHCASPCLLLDHRSDKTLVDIDPPEDYVAFLIGPEGGFSLEERNHAAKAGCIGVRMGPRILRTETAPLAAIAAAQTLWGDFR